MVGPLNILLGANGDLCAMLPFLRMEAERIGKRAPVFVAREYAPLLDGVSYVEPVEWDGEWHDLRAALRYLRRDLPDAPVRLLQFYQSLQERAMDSFVDEMWYMAGSWKGWRERELVFDRRDLEREARLARDCGLDEHRPVILVGLRGRSQPFPWAKELLQMIRRRFRKVAQIVDLSRVRAERIYDLLGLYDRAAVLVSADTVHLHLSKASKIPVVALSTDWPSLWHGTPWMPHFAWHGRYAEWKARWEEMCGVIEKAVAVRLPDGAHESRSAASIERHERELRVITGLPRFAYNPSVFGNNGTMHCIARHHVEATWRTKLTVDGKRVGLWSRFGACSHEDARVFMHNDRIMVSLTLARANRRHRARCVQAYGGLHPRADGNGWVIRDLRIPRFGHNDWSALEKNWVFLSYDGAVHAIYACHPRHVVLRLCGSEVLTRWSTRGPRWAWGHIRGGTPPLPFAEGQWLRFFHSRTGPVRRKGHETLERYHMGALVMEAAPPFRVLAVSRRPILSGDERPVFGCRHWKANVVIPYGAVRSTDGQACAWEVSVGVNDAMACLVTVHERELDLVWAE